MKNFRLENFKKRAIVRIPETSWYLQNFPPNARINKYWKYLEHHLDHQNDDLHFHDICCHLLPTMMVKLHVLTLVQQLIFVHCFFYCDVNGLLLLLILPGLLLSACRPKNGFFSSNDIFYWETKKSKEILNQN